MRHKSGIRHLGRTSSKRRALYRTLTTDILLHGKVKTTIAKAKAVQPIVERVITLGRKGDLHSRRRAAAFITQKRIVKTLFDDLAPLFEDRSGGYTRIVKLPPRTGDGAHLAVIELTEQLIDVRESE